MVKKKWKLCLLFLFVVFFVLLLPKFVECAFNTYISECTALHKIDEKDYLNYISSIIGSVCALAAVIVAINQFSTEKKPFIIPQNKIFYYYLEFDFKHKFQESKDLDTQPVYPLASKPITFKLENATDSAAISFSIEIDYGNGKFYDAICRQIDGTPSTQLGDIFKKKIYPNQGVFNNRGERLLFMPCTVRHMIKEICQCLSDSSDPKRKAERWDLFLNKSYKIAEMKISTRDILGKNKTVVYDMNINFTDMMSKPVYECYITYCLTKEI